MCGRYALYGPVSRLREAFYAVPEGFEFEPRWNAAPMQWLPVVRQRPNGERVIHRMRWGLVPSWSKDETIATRLINARGESVAEKPSFRAAFRRRRCIVPANGFYEWQQVAGGKQPFYIHPVGGEFFALAGLWERWTWVNGATAAVQALVRPCAEAVLAVYPVGKAVGNVRNEEADSTTRLLAQPPRCHISQGLAFEVLSVRPDSSRDCYQIRKPSSCAMSRRLSPSPGS